MFTRPLFATVVGITAMTVLAVSPADLAYSAAVAPPANQSANQAKQQQMAAQRKQLEDARAAVEAARKDIARVRERIEATFTGKDEYATAKKDYEAAQKEFDSLSKSVIAAARRKPEFVQAVANRDKAQAIIDRANNPAASASGAGSSDSGSSDEALTQDQIRAAVDQRWKAGIAIRQIESDALAEDPKVTDAKSKRDEAKHAWDAAQAQVTEAMEADPEYAKLETQLKTAEQQLASVRQSIAGPKKTAGQGYPPQRRPPQPPGAGARQ